MQLTIGSAFYISEETILLLFLISKSKPQSPQNHNFLHENKGVCLCVYKNIYRTTFTGRK